MFFDDSSTKAVKRFEKILDTLKNKDKDALKLLFSEKALEESTSIDEDIDYLFDFFQGEFVSYKNTGSMFSSLNEYGNRTTEVKSKFYIDTDKQKYVAFIIEYTEDTIHPENIGLYTLRIIKAEDEWVQSGYWPDMKIPGIYRPEVERNRVTEKGIITICSIGRKVQWISFAL
ncbi:MAG: DUF5104 domain-containing protein [Treponema sp.]|jgi:hypothetical protein|nr:DUF5104 domain-containing protein [Treponema sp.]